MGMAESIPEWAMKWQTILRQMLGEGMGLRNQEFHYYSLSSRPQTAEMLKIM
jgi:hypothetical protein